MASTSNLPGRISIAIATLSILLATMIDSGMFHEKIRYGAPHNDDCFYLALLVCLIGGIIGLGFAWRGFRRSGRRSWTNWIGLTLSLLPLLFIATLVLLLVMR
ncbi:hypothetical protein NHH82_29625 [Oxalobacteraceae bacterium OTU3REALA1]|nr:hypothetical protein NHH82_29625 [Oxalobacteraceae bacterium OTU3REALA1]